MALPDLPSATGRAGDHPGAGGYRIPMGAAEPVRGPNARSLQLPESFSDHMKGL
jgi:hypothetical protein